MSIISPVSLEISSTISYLKHEESYFYYVVTQSNIGFGLSFSFASRHVPHIFCPLVCFSICSFFPLCFCLVGQNTYTRTDGNDDQQFISASSTPRPSYDDANEGVVPTHKRYSIYAGLTYVHACSPQYLFIYSHLMKNWSSFSSFLFL